MWPTLIGNGNAAILGLPQNFNLASKLLDAKEIRLASAFAHANAWSYFADSIANGKANVFLLTGLDCFQTEPKLLRKWLDLKSAAANRIDARLASNESFFHPKVLLLSFDGSQAGCAIVGSGNLSIGGISTNTECSLYIDDAKIVAAVKNWYDRVFESGLRLTDVLINAYEPDYEKHKAKRVSLSSEGQRTAEKLQHVARGNDGIMERCGKICSEVFCRTRI